MCTCPPRVCAGILLNLWYVIRIISTSNHVQGVTSKKQEHLTIVFKYVTCFRVPFQR